MKKHNYRYEIKYIITKNHAEILKSRLKLIMHLDKYSVNGSYYIKSLYFDDLDNTAYYEKIDGVLFRSKYRIRVYNNNDEKIYLERKNKSNNLTSKDKQLITKENYSKIIDRKIENIEYENGSLLERFITDVKTKKLVPSVIVGYRRYAYTYPASNVRITFDENITSQVFNYNLFSSNATNVNILEDNEVVLEVKYDDILPDFIKRVIGTIPEVRESVSKFQRCKNVGGV